MTVEQVERLGRDIHNGAVWLFSLEVVIFLAVAVGAAWLVYLAYAS